LTPASWELGRRYDPHPVYDMVYVAVAERLGEELVTADVGVLNEVRHLGFVRGLA
jgi:predicted nucleic acid-binding protein